MTGATNFIELFNAGGGSTGVGFLMSFFTSALSSLVKVVTSVIFSTCFGLTISISRGRLNPTTATTAIIKIDILCRLSDSLRIVYAPYSLFLP